MESGTHLNADSWFEVTHHARLDLGLPGVLREDCHAFGFFATRHESEGELRFFDDSIALLDRGAHDDFFGSRRTCVMKAQGHIEEPTPLLDRSLLDRYVEARLPFPRL